MRADWWTQDDAHDAVISISEEIRSMQSHEFWKCRIHRAIYSADSFGKQRGKYAAAMALLRSTGFASASLNVTRSAVDALVAKLGTKMTAVRPKTIDAEWKVRRKARRMGQFVAGKRESAGYNRLRPLLVRDALLTGTAVVQTAPEHGDIAIDRVPREEILVNPWEARYGKPRQLFRQRTMSREKLAALFPSKRASIEAAGMAELPKWDESYQYVSEHIVSVWEGWHLPSAPEADDGRYVICIEGTTLHSQKWERSRFPFAFLHYCRPDRGFWGTGLVEILAPLQHKVNEIAKDLQEALYFGGQTKMLVRRGSGVNQSHLGKGRHPHTVEVDNPADVTWMPPNPVAQYQLQYLQWMIDLMYELSGVSKLSAQAKKPPGLQSGVALQEYYDIQSERFADFEQNLGHCDVEVSELLIDEAKSLYQDNPDFAADWADQTLIHRIKWADVDMARDEFRMQLEPTSFLPDTRAGKLQLSEKLAEMGIIQGAEIGNLLGGHPDVDKVMRRRNAPLNAVLHHVELLKDEDENLPTPDSHMNLELAMEVMAAEYNDAIAEGAPEEVLERFDEYMQMLEDMAAKTAPAQAPQPGAIPPDGMQPPGVEALPPGAAPEALPGQALPGMA